MTPTAALDEAAGLAAHRPMLDVDETSIRRRLEALPWVARVQVRRSWPSTLRVTVVERHRVAALAGATGCPSVGSDSACFAWVDSTGRVLKVDAADVGGVPLLGGLAEPGGPGAELGADAGPSLAVVALLQPPLAALVTEVRPYGTDEVILRLGNGGIVRLGGPTEMANKLAAAATVIGQQGMKGFPVLDVRVPAAPVLSPVPLVVP